MKVDLSFNVGPGKESPGVKDLLDSARDFLGELNKKDEIFIPSRVHLTLAPLVPVGITLNEVIVNLYHPDGTYPPNPYTLWPESYSVLVHGHVAPPMGHCAGPHFCHLYGYTPEGNEPKEFITCFYLKWKELR